MPLYRGLPSVPLDPFAGRGSTGVAALGAGRRFVGIELLECYATEAAERIQQAAKVGCTFEEAMAQDRGHWRFRDLWAGMDAQTFLDSLEPPPKDEDE